MREAKRTVSSTEFVCWCVYLRDQKKERTKQDYYLAQIALEMRRSWVKDKNGVKIEELFLKYEDAVENGPQSPDKALAASKAFWGQLAQQSREGTAGRKDGKPVHTKPPKQQTRGTK